MCWHSWSKWAAEQHGDVVRSKDRSVIARVFIMKRTCAKCGLVRRDSQIVDAIP